MEMVFPSKPREYHFPGLWLKSPLQSARKTQFFSIRVHHAFSPPRTAAPQSRCASGGSPGPAHVGSPRSSPGTRSLQPRHPAREPPCPGTGLCPADEGVWSRAEAVPGPGAKAPCGCRRSPARSRFPEGPGLSHTSVQKTLAAAESPAWSCRPVGTTLALGCRSRPGTSVPRYPRTAATQRGPTARTAAPPVSLPRAYKPDSRLVRTPSLRGGAPRFHGVHPPPKKGASRGAPISCRGSSGGRRGAAPQLLPLLPLLCLFHICYPQDG